MKGLNDVETEYEKIIALIKRQVVPALGCTEPVVVAVCAALAAETLGRCPERVAVRLSANMLKNAMGVGIPHTGMTGLPIAVSLGIVAGRSADGLEIFKRMTDEDVERGKRFLTHTLPEISLKESIDDKLYVEVEVAAEGDTVRVVQRGSHTSRPSVERNGETVGAGDMQAAECCREDYPELTLRKVYDFAMTVPLGDIEFIAEAERLNMAAAEVSFKGEYGHGLGRILRCDNELRIMGDTLFSRILAYTSGACDARMSGAMVPVMSNSGSGNQGIAATVPVVVYGRECGASRERMLRALVLSHLTVIYIKHSLGCLSALCGCVVAATGSSCGITYLMGGGYEEITFAVKNMVANLTGMICDGAKPSCSLKVTSGVSTSVLSAMLAMEHRCTTSVEGIVDDDVDKCIRNLTTIGREAMNETDRMILNIMTTKCK